MKKFQVLTVFLLVGLLFTSVVGANAIDFGGKTITVVGGVDKLEDQRKSGLLAQAEELFNVKIESLVIPSDQTKEIMVTRLISGDSEYDVWAIDNGDNFFPLIASDALLPINEVLGEEYFDGPRQYANAAVQAFSVNNNTYVLSSFETLPNGATVWLAFNKDILEAEGLPSPYDLIFEDNWNWDTFRDLLVAATKDLDGDGEADQFGIMGMATWAHIVSSNGVNFFVPDETGRLIYNWNSDAVLEAMAYGRQLASIDRVTTSGGFYEGQTLFAFRATWELDGLLDSDLRWGLVPFPKGPSAEDYSMYTGFIGGLGLPMNSAQPKEIAAVMDFLFAPANWDTFAEERNAELINVYCPDLQSARIFTDFLPRYGANGTILNYGLTHSDVFAAYSSAMDGEQTPAEAMSSVAAIGQAHVDDLLGFTN